MSDLEAKKPRLEVNPDPEGCAQYVERKKRWCRLSVAKGNQYCGEHSKERCVLNGSPGIGIESSLRIPCPLDPKHTIFADRLTKHLKICNAREQTRPEFIKGKVNAGSEGEEEEDEAANPDKQPARLSDLDTTYIQALVDKVREFYDSIRTSFDPQEEIHYHPELEAELCNTSYGPDTLKHLRQTSALLGSLHRLDLLQENTCFIEFGAGKGQVSYFLSTALKDTPETAVVLVDRASMRHKMDNKCQDRSTVHRVRADIADLDLKAVPQWKEKIVGISKHLCGAATDLSIRCMVKSQAKSQAMVIAVCCHHRCTWKAFVGKSDFRKRNISSRDFLFIIKMVSWAVCGGGMSRERRKLIEEQGGVQTEADAKDPVKTLWSREEQEEIGYMCKRIIDHSRLKYLEEQGYATGAFYYISRDVTLENLCIFAKSNCTTKTSCGNNKR